MKDFTWPTAVVFLGVVAALVILFGQTTDVATRAKLVEYFDPIVPFMVGAAAGGAVGGAAGFARGKNLL
jgi:hypothetical protein